jgi:aminomethyltransferase
MALRHSPVHGRHVALGAKLAEFGGWQMPLEYAGGGVLREHAAVREAVGLFDVSHLGKIRVEGAGTREFLDRCLTNSFGRISPGQAQYTLCCDDATGGVVDDLIAYYASDEHVGLVPNAANAAEVLRRLSSAAPAGVTLTDQHEQIAVFAVQGPRSANVVGSLGLPADLDYMSMRPAAWHGDTVVCRTGYTGEHGYELLVPSEQAAGAWDELLEAVTGAAGLPCGLGARDTLRTEMGYPLHGQDLSLSITPVQARLGWAVGWDKPAFWGREALTRERAEGAGRLLWGLRAEDRGIPRPHMAVMRDGAQVGEVTSGTFSPTLRVGIGLAVLDRSVGEGDEVAVDVRGRPSTMRVVKPPFVDSSPK